MFSDQDGCIYGTGKSRIGRMQFKHAIQLPGLFHVELGLVRIVLSLGQFGGKVLVVAWNRVIVSEISITAQNLVHQLFTVNGVFEPQPDIVVVIGLDGSQHGNGIMPGAL